MQFLLSRHAITPVAFSGQFQLIPLIVALMILLMVPGRTILVSVLQLDGSSSAWMDRSPQPMQPLQRIELDQA